MKKYFLFISISTVILLSINYFLGSQNIIAAHKAQFRGGMCGACESCIAREPICSKKFGFDFYYLLTSTLGLSFMLGVINVLFNRNLAQSLSINLLGVSSFIIATDIIVRVFSIPVLFTSFQEGRQSLGYHFLFQASIQFLILFSIFCIIPGMVGNIVGYPIFLLINKKNKKQ